MNLTDVKLFLRKMYRDKLYSVVTVFGFAIALTFVFLLSLYIRQELTVDSFHVNKNRIFRLISEKGSIASPVLGESLQQDNPEIEAYTRLYGEKGFVETPEKQKVSFSFLLADPSFFTMFSFPLVEGEAGKVLQTPREIVLSRSFAARLFGSANPLGKMLRYNSELEWIVTGIMEDLPANTHFRRCDAVVAFPALADIWGDPTMMARDGNATFGLYLLAKEGSDLGSKAKSILEQLKNSNWLYDENEEDCLKEVKLEPLEKIYFSSWTEEEGIHGNSKSFVAVFSAIVFVILILAFINYTNLTVAQSLTRMREAGMRKILGSSRGRLIRQFMTESVLLCTFSFMLAIGLARLMVPVFSKLLQTTLLFGGAFTWKTVFFMGTGIVLLGLIAGFVPARLITRIQAVEVMKGAFRQKTKGKYGKMLICFQYTMTILLTICTFILWKQTDYMRTTSLGYEKENVVWLQGMIRSSQKETLRGELEKIAGVTAVSYAIGSPLNAGYSTSYLHQGRDMDIRVMEADDAFFKVLGLQVKAAGTASSSGSVWLNETAVRELELDSLPQFIKLGQEIPVAGVVKDFHFRDMTQRIQPLVIMPLKTDTEPREILVKIAGHHPGVTYRQVCRTYSEFIGELPYESGFMDATVNSWYQKQEWTTRLIGYFSGLALVLSMMGILAMATYFVRQRIKEIGIRRVNGATVQEILQMLMNSFMKWIVVAFVMACPVGYYVMTRWLSDFAYRTSMDWWVFALSGGLALCIAALMICWQTWQAASANPVEALKTE